MDTKSLKLESLINSWTLRNHNLALVTEDGLTLISRTHHVTDLCSLPSAIQTTQQYLKLRDGELAICNDPYMGGSLTSQITLVTAFRCPASSKDAEQVLLLGMRISTRPRLTFGKSMDEDGLKIPPTPLGSLEAPTEAILGAIAAHPLSPDDFLDRVEKGLSLMKSAKASFIAALAAFDVDLTRSLCQSFVQDSHHATQTLLSEFPHGRSEVQWLFETGDKLRLKVENTGNRLILDFTGTGQVPGFHLTEAHILGCAVRTLEQMSNHSIRVNSGSLLAFNTSAPRQSMVSSQSPASTTLGVLVGSNLLCDLIARALGLLHPKKKSQISSSSPTALAFQFQNRSFFDLLPSGSLATADRRGEAAIDTWNESSLSPSVEDIESRFPLEILALKKRTDSGGQGDQKGGDGILKTYRLLEAARLRWFSGFALKHETNTNSGLGQPPEIIIKIGEEESRHTELRGEISLPAGSLVTALSRGGHAS